MLFPLEFTGSFLLFLLLAAIEIVSLHYVIILTLVENFLFWYLLYTLSYIFLLPIYAKHKFEKFFMKTIKIKGLEAQSFERNADRNLTRNTCIGS